MKQIEVSTLLELEEGEEVKAIHNIGNENYPEGSILIATNKRVLWVNEFDDHEESDTPDNNLDRAYKAGMKALDQHNENMIKYGPSVMTVNPDTSYEGLKVHNPQDILNAPTPDEVIPSFFTCACCLLQRRVAETRCPKCNSLEVI